MTPSEQYRKLAANLRVRARNERSANVRAEWEHLARCYIRLAEQAEQNSWTDVIYEPILRRYRADLEGEPVKYLAPHG